MNYVRTLQPAAAADTSHALPGETGDKLPGVSQMGPTRPAPYYHVIGAQAGAREGLMGVAKPVDSVSTVDGHANGTPAVPAKPPTRAKKP